jgi:hypothetical protein
MNPENMERLIKNLGSSYDALIANKIIDDLPLEDLYEDGETLEVEPAQGIELVFWPETLRFEVIYITLRDGDDSSNLVYLGELPAPFNQINDQRQVRNIFGKPIFSKGAMQLHGTGLSGWDTYQLEPNWHPAAFVEFQYKHNMQVCKLIFSLIDKNI